MQHKILYFTYFIFILLVGFVIIFLVFIADPLKKEKSELKKQRVQIKIGDHQKNINELLHSMPNSVMVIANDTDFTLQDEELPRGVLVNIAGNILLDEMSKITNKNNLIQLTFTEQDNQNSGNFIWKFAKIDFIKFKIQKMLNKIKNFQGFTIYLQENENNLEILHEISKFQPTFFVNLNPQNKNINIKGAFVFNAEMIINSNDNLAVKINHISKMAKEKMIIFILDSNSLEQISEIEQLLHQAKLQIVSMQELKNHLLKKKHDN